MASFSLEGIHSVYRVHEALDMTQRKTTTLTCLLGAALFLFATAYADDSNKDKLGSYKFLKTITNGSYGIMF